MSFCLCIFVSERWGSVQKFLESVSLQGCAVIGCTKEECVQSLILNNLLLGGLFGCLHLFFFQPLFVCVSCRAMQTNLHTHATKMYDRCACMPQSRTHEAKKLTLAAVISLQSHLDGFFTGMKMVAAFTTASPT